MANKKSLFEIIKAFLLRLFRLESRSEPQVESHEMPEIKQTEPVNNKVSTKPEYEPESADVTLKEIDTDDAADDMSWSEFENLIIKLFQQRNYSLVEKRAVTDNTSDLVLQMNNETTLVDCKQWKDAEVDVSAVSDLYDLMEKDNADHGIVVTSGIFTRDAIDFSLGKAILLINGQDLFQMVQALSKGNVSTPGIAEEEAKIEIDSFVPAMQEMPELDPLCPICSMKMIKRTAKKGKNKGNHFWGCSQYPRCRGVVAVE